jgi:SAM-dependent methyltransferase
VKQYDRAYFERWYRSRRRVVTADAIRRRAYTALSVAEYFHGRPVRTVLDVGCGEGSWRAALRSMRPRLRWTGVDPSDYVVRRFGRRRGIRLGSLANLADLQLRGSFDLIVCSDVLHYLPTAEIRRGLPELARLLNGIAWLDAFTVDDAMDGDREGWHLRTAAQYRRLFAQAGLTAVGVNCWTTRNWASERVGCLEGASTNAGA